MVLTSVLFFLTAMRAVAQGNGCTEAGGNWYCNQISSIMYNNVGINGTYQRVTDMNGCETTPQAYGGSLAPFNEEVAIAFRGPIQLKGFAAYAPANVAKERLKIRRAEERAERDLRPRAHGHRHGKLHERRSQAEEPQELGEKRAETVIYATIFGQLASWTTDIAGPTAAPVPAPNPAPSVPPNPPLPSPPEPTVAPPPVPAPDYNPSPPPPPGSQAPATGPGQWMQVAHYDSSSPQANGITFMKSKYAPLTYMAPDGCSTAQSPQVLKDAMIPSNEEFVMFSDMKCSGQNGDCGYYNPAIGGAFHGWSGSKIFLFEFAMPHDGESAGLNPDAPAIWLLNAQVPRTDQYGCSCWQSGCGELDLFEVLTSGEQRCKSTFHDAQSLGSSDWFQRPIGSPVKAAVYMDDSAVVIKMLDGSFDFSGSLNADAIKTFVSNPAVTTSLPMA